MSVPFRVCALCRCAANVRASGKSGESMILLEAHASGFGAPTYSYRQQSGWPHFKSCSPLFWVASPTPIPVGSWVRVAYVKPSDTWPYNTVAGARDSFTQVRKGSNRSLSHTASRVGSVILVSGLHASQIYPPGT